MRKTKPDYGLDSIPTVLDTGDIPFFLVLRSPMRKGFFEHTTEKCNFTPQAILMLSKFYFVLLGEKILNFLYKTKKW